MQFTKRPRYYINSPSSPSTTTLLAHNVTNSQLAQLDHCTGIAEVMGSNPFTTVQVMCITAMINHVFIR